LKFEDLPQVQKATIAEKELDKFLMAKGIVPYLPSPGAAHPFDRLCASADKKNLFVAEVKAKASRTFYPDTGMNVSNYNDYINIRDKYGIDVWVFFIDEFRKQIYGNLLTELERSIRIEHNGKSLQYPLIQPDYKGKEIIYFPLVKMIKICDLDSEVAESMGELSNRNYEYPTYELNLQGA